MGARLSSVGRGGTRWAICALLFLAIVFNYMDRQMIALLKPSLQKDFGWTEASYADIVFYFQLAYAASYLVWGRLVDRLGAKIGYAAAFSIWTLGHLSHGLAHGARDFIVSRIFLGVGEAGSFPAGIKAIATWFPKQERALATGFSSAGANIGAIVTPLVVPFIAVDLAIGWRATFLITGVASLIWLVLWGAIYQRPEEHRGVSSAELAHIQSDSQDDAAIAGSFRKALCRRESWGYALGRFFIDPVWWLFLFWLPDFFARQYHMGLKGFGPPLVAIYIMSDAGSVAGGWLSGALLRRGLNLNAARKLAMFVCALAVVPVAGVQYVSNVWLSVFIFGLATAGHQGFSANLFSLPGDVFPKRMIGSVLGIGGTVGAIGGMVMAKYAGFILQRVGQYGPLFTIASFCYLLALLAVHIGSPRYAEVHPNG